MDDNWNMITVTQAAGILGVKPSTINGWIAKNKAPFPFYKDGRYVRIKKTDVVAYLQRIRNGN